MFQFGENFLLKKPEPICNFGNKKHFIVQFSKGSKDIVHSITNKENIIWPEMLQVNPRDVFLCVDEQKQRATILFAHDDKEVIKSEFLKLRAFCFQSVFDERDEDLSIADDAWILVLHTCGPFNVVYTVLNQRNTYKHLENPYKDVITYLSDGQNVFLAIIIRKSNQLETLLKALEIMRLGCINTISLPLQNFDETQVMHAIPPPGFNSFVGKTDDFEGNARHNCLSPTMEAALRFLESQMKNEVALLLHSIDVLENSKRAI